MASPTTCLAVHGVPGALYLVDDQGRKITGVDRIELAGNGRQLTCRVTPAYVAVSNQQGRAAPATEAQAQAKPRRPRSRPPKPPTEEQES